MQTIKHWHYMFGNKPSFSSTSLAVLTDDTSYTTNDPRTGRARFADFPAGFESAVFNALHWLSHTYTGMTVLRTLSGSGPTVTICPSEVSNSCRSTSPGEALNKVALELLINGRPGSETKAALARKCSDQRQRPAWLATQINESPRWRLDDIPGIGGGFTGFAERARLKMNQWLLWSDTNEGYFSDKLWGSSWSQTTNNLGITPRVISRWLDRGTPLPENAKEHVITSTIVALKDTSASGGTSGSTVGWNIDPDYELNGRRPPAIGLGHELIHAYYSKKGMQCGLDSGHFSTVLFEYLCVGLGPWDESRLSENSLRKEWFAQAVPKIPKTDTQNRKATPKRIKYS